MWHRLLLTLLLSLSAVCAQAAEVQTVNDLRADYANGAEKKVMLLLVSQPGCSYCERIREEIIHPMTRNPDYHDYVLFRTIQIYTADSMIDYDGQRVETTAFARRYDAWATPTLLFLDHNGKELAPKMVGFNTPEFYGYYVDQHLEQAHRALNP